MNITACCQMHAPRLVLWIVACGLKTLIVCAVILIIMHTITNLIHATLLAYKKYKDEC